MASLHGNPRCHETGQVARGCSIAMVQMYSSTAVAIVARKDFDKSSAVAIKDVNSQS